MFHLLCGTQDEKSSEGHTGVALPGRQGHLAEGEEPSGFGVSGARVSAFAFTSHGRRAPALRGRALWVHTALLCYLPVPAVPAL